MVLQLLNIRVGIGQSLLENNRKRKPSSQNCDVMPRPSDLLEGVMVQFVRGEAAMDVPGREHL